MNSEKERKRLYIEKRKKGFEIHISKTSTRVQHENATQQTKAKQKTTKKRTRKQNLYL